MDELILQLIEAVKKRYKREDVQKRIFANLLREPGSTSYEFAYDLAKTSGRELEDALIESWNKIMSGDDVYASTLRKVLEEVVPLMDEDVIKACDTIQHNMNEAAGLGVKTREEIPEHGDIWETAERMDGKKIENIDGSLSTMACKTVDGMMFTNMDFMMSLGFAVEVVRKYDGVGLRRGTKHAEKCKYCASRAGNFMFKTTKDARNSGVFARHEGCGCTIDYQNVVTKTTTANVQNYKGRK